jgi:hypothetical protein
VQTLILFLWVLDKIICQNFGVDCPVRNWQIPKHKQTKDQLSKSKLKPKAYFKKCVF